MQKKTKLSNLIFSCLMISMLGGFSGCNAIAKLSPPTATPTLIPPTSTPLPSPTPVPPTATPEPTNTATPTATALPPLSVIPDGINPWCLTKKFFSEYTDGPNGPASMPDRAQAGTINKKTTVITFPIPALSCTLVLVFNQPAPTGMKLQIWDARPENPFITYDMLIDRSNPNAAYAVMTHTYLIDPPKWWLDYTLVVVTADNKEVFRNPIRVQKWLPEKCWDGSYPDPITMFCPIQDQ